jgi:hypothetical protein
LETHGVWKGNSPLNFKSVAGVGSRGNLDPKGPRGYHASMSDTSTRLRDIVGEQLSAVSFVQDYVEFHFDGPVLRVYTQPRIVTVGGEFRFPETGSRDALCSAIADIVQDIEIREHDRIVLHFATNRKITVPIVEEGYAFPEAFTFQTEPYNSPLEVWNSE